MKLLTIRCPAFGENCARHLVAREEYPPIAPQIVGGIIAALVFVLSRRRRFRCDRCGELFSYHTLASRLWLALWFLFLISLGFGLARIFIGGWTG
jgi:hypothetical protein